MSEATKSDDLIGRDATKGSTRGALAVATSHPTGGAYLDRDHQARVSRVAGCDTAAGRQAAAESEMGQLTEDEQELAADHKALGTDEHLDAIERSPWSSNRQAIRRGARRAWLLDALLWLGLWGGLWWLWRDYYKEAGQQVPGWFYIAGPIGALAAALGCARVAKGFGQHLAATWLTRPNQTGETIDRQVRIVGRTSLAAAILLLAVLAAVLFSTPSWSSWITYASGVIAFGANIVLGLSAGVGTHVADLLHKPAMRDTIDCEIEMKRRTRLHLQKFLAALLAALACSEAFAAGMCPPGSVWIWAVDVTDSMDAGQREQGLDRMIEAAPDRAAALGACSILVVKFTEDLLLSDMIWIVVPVAPPAIDCKRAAVARVVSKSWISLSPSLALGRQEAATKECLTRQAHEREGFALQQRRLQERLSVATKLTPRVDGTTQIVPLVQALVDRPYARAIDVLTDGVDHSGISPSRLRIPHAVPVTFIITRPNPNRSAPTLQEVLEAADEWARVPGITVTTVGEYGEVAASGGGASP